MRNSCPFTVIATSYVLGVLDPVEEWDFRVHAAECPACDREVAELTPVSRVLAGLRTGHR
jgi:anti-sigma factor RsiW